MLSNNWFLKSSKCVPKVLAMAFIVQVGIRKCLKVISEEADWQGMLELKCRCYRALWIILWHKGLVKLVRKKYDGFTLRNHSFMSRVPEFGLVYTTVMANPAMPQSGNPRVQKFKLEKISIIYIIQKGIPSPKAKSTPSQRTDGKKGAKGKKGGRGRGRK